MIQIDMQMPNSCLECRFRDTVQSGCNAAEEPGFCVFVGLSETEIVEWEDWKKKISSGRDPRCPLRQECKGCSTIFDVTYKAGKDDSIVRCKDCKHGKIHGIDVECVAHEEVGYDPEPWHPLDWFCADGERQEGR